MAVKPDDERILFNLGSAYLKKERFDEAVKMYGQVVKMAPGIGDAHHGLAYAYYMLGKYDLAWNHVNQAKKLGVSVPEDLFRAIQNSQRRAGVAG